MYCKQKNTTASVVTFPVETAAQLIMQKYLNILVYTFSTYGQMDTCPKNILLCTRVQPSVEV